MAEVLFRAKLQREDKATAWGFRLQGGADYSKPLTLLKVSTKTMRKLDFFAKGVKNSKK